MCVLFSSIYIITPRIFNISVIKAYVISHFIPNEQSYPAHGFTGK